MLLLAVVTEKIRKCQGSASAELETAGTTHTALLQYPRPEPHVGLSERPGQGGGVCRQHSSDHVQQNKVTWHRSSSADSLPAHTIFCCSTSIQATAFVTG